eukprot:4386086-Pleurochrysis_carterae.AAC.2
MVGDFGPFSSCPPSVVKFECLLARLGVGSIAGDTAYAQPEPLLHSGEWRAARAVNSTAGSRLRSG